MFLICKETGSLTSNIRFILPQLISNLVPVVYYDLFEINKMPVRFQLVEIVSRTDFKIEKLMLGLRAA